MKKYSFLANPKFMKKHFVILAFLSLLSARSMYSQSFEDRIHFETTVGKGLPNKGITPIDFSVKFAVDVLPIFYAYITAEDNLSLYKSQNVKTYSNGTGLGGGLGVKLLHRIESKHALDVRAKALSSLGNPDWKRTTYDVSLAWYMKSEKFSPVVELGYRYIDSRTKSFDNYGNVYLSIGLRY